jgi:cold shock protein
MEGKVKFFNRVKGFGFITGDDGKDYFVHYSGLAQGTFIREGDIVSFDGSEGDRGLKAENITLVKKASEIAGEGGSQAPVKEPAPEDAAPEDDGLADEETTPEAVESSKESEEPKEE